MILLLVSMLQKLSPVSINTSIDIANYKGNTRIYLSEVTGVALSQDTVKNNANLDCSFVKVKG